MKINLFGKQIEMKTGVAVFVAVILILLGCLAGYMFFSDDSDIIVETADDSTPRSNGNAAGRTVPADTASEAGLTGAAVTVKEQIKVYVVGCVNQPGIVNLEKGMLIDDAVREAGGLTSDADADSINMVYPLNENTMLYIKSRKEMEQKVPAASDINERGGQGDGGLGKGAELIRNSGESVELISDNAGDGKSGSADTTSININTADAGELDKLPGVGEATARDIIAYREKNGPFRKIEDIMKVPRIKQNRFESIKDLISVK